MLVKHSFGVVGLEVSAYIESFSPLQDDDIISICHDKKFVENYILMVILQLIWIKVI